MKKIVTLLALCICITASAESRRLLTMEEAILSRELIPQNYSVVWSASHPNHFLHYSDSEWSAVNIHTGEASPATAPSKPKAQFKTVENNIVRIMDDGTERKVTDFSDPNIVAGGSVSRNEFGIDSGLFPSPNGELLAFYQKDESRVSTFPLLDITTRTGTLKQIKYPMNSMASEVVSVGVYNLANESITYLSVTDFDSEQYLTNLTWSPDSSTIYLQVLDRAQKNMHLNAYNATTGEFIRTLLTEHSDKYVEPSYPLYFLDFETMQDVVPQYEGTKPYQQIPFQYSLHWIEKPGGELKHTAFLAESGKDPRRALAEQLCMDIPLNACTTAYNKGFECGRINELAEAFPDLSCHLLNIRDNIVDFLDPFRAGYYYLPAMCGSFSIKKVLPALFPDDPALNYHNLEQIHNGGEAMSIFPKIKDMTPEDAATTRHNLLKYCELDTYAMVKVWEKLKTAIGE